MHVSDIRITFALVSLGPLKRTPKQGRIPETVYVYYIKNTPYAMYYIPCRYVVMLLYVPAQILYILYIPYTVYVVWAFRVSKLRAESSQPLPAGAGYIATGGHDGSACVFQPGLSIAQLH